MDARNLSQGLDTWTREEVSLDTGTSKVLDDKIGQVVDDMASTQFYFSIYQLSLIESV